MDLIPRKIYEDFISEKKSKNESINLLINLIENIDDDIIRNDCVDILNKFDLIHLKVFKILEDILISDQNQNLRYSAAQVMRDKFIKKCLNPFIWTLQHETSYDVLITVIKSLNNTDDNRIVSLLMDELRKTSNNEIWDGIIPLIKQNLFKQASLENIVDILINLVTLNYLKKKFHVFDFIIDNGFIIEVDFSKVDNHVINWRDRNASQDTSEIIGIANLKKIRKVKFFPIKWAISNEYNYKNAIALIKALERLNSKAAKDALISQIKLIEDNEFNCSIKHYFKQFEELSISKLSDIFRNYLTFTFMKKKYPVLNYKVSEGEVVSIHIEKVPLIKVPFYIKYFRSLQSLTLKDCNLHNLSKSIGLKCVLKSIFSLRSLKVLKLSNNKLEKIPDSIGKLSSLQYLSLEINNLVKLPKSIGNLSLLKFLNLRENKLTEIPSSIGELKSLKTLDLSKNKIRSLPESIGLLYSLKLLNLSNNSLERLPNSLNSISSLNKLNLEDNNLKSLPRSMGLLEFLEVLKLGWNRLKRLPNSFAALKSLKSLHLNNNNLLKLSSSICLITSLEYLDASFNKIYALPDDLNKLRSLKVLKLNDNQFKNLPDSIGSLYSLEKLDFSGNSLESLPKSVVLLQSLKEIWLNGNKLKTLPDSIIKLKSIKKIMLNGNPIMKVPEVHQTIKSKEEISVNLEKLNNISDSSSCVRL
jgi:Leucine-rich repeat (LRR) protein